MKRFITTISLFMLMLFTFVACNQANNNEKATEKLTKVRLAEVTHSLFYAPLYVAINEGFFEDEGIDLELTTTPGGDKTMTALLSDGADIALVGSETSIYVANQGAKDKVINFAQLTQTDGTFLVAREDDSAFSWDDLNGKTFLGQREGGMPQMVGEYVLKQHEIDPENDLTLIQNIDFANIASAFASGTGDYVQLFEPTASIFEKEGKGHIVASFGIESGTVPYTTFMAKESYLTKDKDAVAAFTRAIYKAQKWVDSHTAEEIANSLETSFADTEKDIIISAIERYQSQYSYATNPILDEKEWNQLQEIMKEAGALDKDVSYQELVNTNFAKDVMKE